MKRAATAVGSLKETEFDIRFNPDVYSPGVKHVDNLSASDSLKRQRQLVKDAADFLVTTQIPNFVCLQIYYIVFIIFITLKNVIH